MFYQYEPRLLLYSQLWALPYKWEGQLHYGDMLFCSCPPQAISPMEISYPLIMIH